MRNEKQRNILVENDDRLQLTRKSYNTEACLDNYDGESSFNEVSDSTSYDQKT